jgi:hypothetical protein
VTEELVRLGTDQPTQPQGPPGRVFLHIGLPKTGTTYLQDVAWANKQTLAAHGVLVPGPHRRRHYLASLDVRDDPKLERRPGDVAHPWDDLVREILEWDGDALVSHEFFGAASVEQVRRVADSLQDRELHVVVTARSVYDVGLTIWQEVVKFGSAMSVDVYPKRTDYDPTNEWGWASWDLGEVLDRWGEVVPHDRIHVLAVARRPDEPAALWHAYADLIGVDPSEYVVPDVPSNPALGLVEVELLRRINEKLDGFTSAPDRGRWIRSYLAQGDILPQRQERFRPGPDKHEELMRRARRAVQVLTTGGYDFRGEFDLLVPHEQSGLRHPDEVTPQEMLDSATTAIANLMRDVRPVTRERQALHHEVEALKNEVRATQDALAERSRSTAHRAARRVRTWWSDRQDERRTDGGPQ